MTDDDVHRRIDELVTEEHRLRSHPAPTDDDRQRLARLEVQLDQAWDLLRRRQAAREAGGDGGDVTERPAGQVEGYLQ